MQNNGDIENPFEEEKEGKLVKKPKRQKKKLVVFAVAEPKNEKDYPKILDVLEQRENTLLLHNRYNYTNEKGKAVLAQLKDKSLPTSAHTYERMMRQEFWGIKNSHVVVFDLDSIDSFHLMAVAALLDKPIVCISETLRPIPLYFTGSVVGVFKISDLEMILKTVVKKKRRRRKPNNGDELLNHKPKDKTQNTATKENIQDMLQKSLQKHLGSNEQELR